jgi:hypothetical protein
MVSIGVPPTWLFTGRPRPWPLTSTRRFRYWNRRASGRRLARSGMGRRSRPGGSTSVPSECSAQPPDCLVRPRLEELPGTLDCDAPSRPRWPIRGTWPEQNSARSGSCAGAIYSSRSRHQKKWGRVRPPTIFDFAGTRGFRIPSLEFYRQPHLRSVRSAEAGRVSPPVCSVNASDIGRPNKCPTTTCQKI